MKAKIHHFKINQSILNAEKCSANKNNWRGTLYYLIGRMSFDAKDIKDKVTAVIKSAYDIGVDGASFEKTTPCIELIFEIINSNIHRVDASWAQLINPISNGDGNGGLEVVKRKNPPRTQRKKDLPPSKKQKSDSDEEKSNKVIPSSDDDNEDDDIEIEFIDYGGNQHQVSPQPKKDSGVGKKQTFHSKKSWPDDEHDDLVRIMKNHPEYTYKDIRDKLVKLGYAWRTDKSVSGKVWNERVRANKHKGDDEDSN